MHELAEMSESSHLMVKVNWAWCYCYCWVVLFTVSSVSGVMNLPEISCYYLVSTFSALTLLVGWQEGHLACKKQWWGAGVVVYLKQACIWPTWCHCHSLSLASVKARLVLRFCYLLTWVVPEKRVCVCILDLQCFDAVGWATGRASGL